MYISARICMQLIIEVMKLTTQNFIIIMNRPKRCCGYQMYSQYSVVNFVVF
jgi:hypothetical protein